MNGRQQRGYPLSSLFVLVAVCAILAGMFAPVLRAVIGGKVEPGPFVGSMVLASFVLAILGLIIGLHHHRRVRGLVYGAATGFGVGLVIGPLAVCPPSEFPSLLVASLGGSAIIVALGVVFRTTDRSSRP